MTTTAEANKELVSRSIRPFKNRGDLRLCTAALLAVALAVAAPARAGEAGATEVVEAAPRWHVSVATEPLDFFLGGYYAWAAVRTPALPHWSFAVGTFAFNLPDVYFQATNPGFHVRAMPSGGIDGDYYFDQAGDGFYLGAALAWFHERYTHDATPGEHADLDGLFTHLNVGYRWMPSQSVRFYLEPWGFLGTFLTRSRGPIVVGDKTFQELPVAFNVAIRIGYDFSL